MIVFLTTFHVLIACFLILVVLIQTGKGSDIGAAFGGGASQTMFGARGAATVLQKITSGLAIGFMATSLILAVLAGQRSGRSLIPDEPPRPAAQPSAPPSQPSPPAPASGPAAPPVAPTKR